MRSHCLSLTLALLLAVACGPAGTASSPTPVAVTAQLNVTLGEEFVLRVSQTAAIGGASGLRLTFDTVREDSRCPIGVTCVWAGDAVVAITVDGSGGTETVELHTNSSFDVEVILDGHTLGLVELTPVPREGSTIEADQYQATLVLRARAETRDPFQSVEAPGRQGAEECAYREYVSDEQRSRAGCIGGLNGSRVSARVLRVRSVRGAQVERRIA